MESDFWLTKKRRILFNRCKGQSTGHPAESIRLGRVYCKGSIGKKEKEEYIKKPVASHRATGFHETVSGVQTARLLGAASATGRGRLFHHFTRLIFYRFDRLIGFFLCLVANGLYCFAGLFLCLVSNFLCCTLSLVLSSANCAVLGFASAAAAGSMRCRQCSTGTDQGCNTQPGQEFFQILTVHTFLLF